MGKMILYLGSAPRAAADYGGDKVSGVDRGMHDRKLAVITGDGSQVYVSSLYYSLNLVNLKVS